MRGKVVLHMKFVQHHRITPAYAGKSYNSVADTYHPQDHPRLCGEKCEISTFRNTCFGSPPPMRGKVQPLHRLSVLLGITPAYAGKRFGTGAAHTVLSGSPPPMRGKVSLIPDFCRLIGITPAYAGKSDVIAATFGTIQDHPRLCGEKASLSTT